MSTSTADRVMQTVTRYFEVAAEDTGTTCEVEDAVRRASADPGFRDALARALEADDSRGSFSACTPVRAADCEADMIAWLPDATGCTAGKVYAIEAKVYEAAGADPLIFSHLVLLLTAAIHVDRSSLGTAEAWALRHQSSAGDIAAVRKTLRRLTDNGVAQGTQQRGACALLGGRPDPAVPFPAPPTEEERREPEHPDLAPDPLRASTPAEFAAVLTQFRQWAGEPSLREMARQARPAVSASTLLTAVRSERLPTLRVVSAFVTGCGGGPEEVGQFTAAWRRIRHSVRLGQPDSEPLEHSTCPWASRPEPPW